tara:strand:+ start:190 stop:381 length:192 start_codon:yes stop_codon:yes gene_type:complete
MTREQAKRLSEALKQHQTNDEFRLALIEKACGQFSDEAKTTWREKGVCDFWPDCSCRNECGRG